MLTEAQKQERKSGIGGSDASAVIGQNEYKSQLTLWLEKTGRIEPEDISQKDAVILGNLFEDDIATFYEIKTGIKVEELKDTLIHPQYPWMRANIDRKIVGQNKILEIKTANTRMRKRKFWGPPGSDHVPTDYFMQVQHYLAFGFDECDLMVFFDTSDVRNYTIKRDEAIINYLIEQESIFWNEYVLKDMPPQPQTRDDVLYIHPDDNGEIIEAPPEVVDVIKSYGNLRKDLERLEKAKREMEARITNTIKDAQGIRADDYLITWKKQKNTRVLRFYGE